MVEIIEIICVRLFENCQAGEFGSVEEGQRYVWVLEKKVSSCLRIWGFQYSFYYESRRKKSTWAGESILSLHALHGFLEVIIPQSLLEELHSFGHSSLYKFYERTSRKWVFSILFGPLSLANGESGNSIDFCGMDTHQLRTMVWHLTYSYTLLSLWNWAQRSTNVQKRYRIADFFKVVDKELSTTFHTMFAMSPLLGVWRGSAVVILPPEVIYHLSHISDCRFQNTITSLHCFHTDGLQDDIPIRDISKAKFLRSLSVDFNRFLFADTGGHGLHDIVSKSPSLY